MPESRPPLFFNFRRGLLSLIFSKNTLWASKLQFLVKILEAKFSGKIAVLRNLEWFFEKIEESKNNGCLHSDISSRMLFSKDMGVKGALGQSQDL